MRDGDLLVMKRTKFGEVYYTLLGGGIQAGETPLQALEREVREEASLRILSAKHVFTEDPGPPYGPQFIFLCEFAGVTARLADDSEEASINQLGQNLHEPMWLSPDMLRRVAFRSEALKHRLLEALKHGFPDEPETINPEKYHAEIHRQRS